jgi:hypothetical protein
METKAFYFVRIFRGAKKDGYELFPPRAGNLRFERGVATVIPKDKDEAAAIQSFVDAKTWPLGEAYEWVKEPPAREAPEAPDTYAKMTSETVNKERGWLSFNEARALLGYNPKQLKELVAAKEVGTRESDGKVLYSEVDCERVKGK